MRFGIKTLVVAIVVYISVGLWISTRAFHLMNMSSDLAVAAGTAILVGLGVLTLALVRPLIRLVRNAVADVRKLKEEIMGRTNLLVLGLVGASIFASGCGCTTVEPGYVGIKVNQWGQNRGVQDTALVTGYVSYNLVSESVFQYPVFVQTAVWTKNPNEGSPIDEQISFNSKEGLVITGDISLSYQLEREKVPAFYVRFRSDDLNAFTHGFLHNIARDAFNETASSYSIEEIYGLKKEELLRNVKDRINKQVADIGVSVQQFGFVGAPRLPEAVVGSINAKIQATQDAMRAENQLRQTEAEAKKKVAEAEGLAKAKVAMAEGDAKANETLTRSITPTLLEWKRLDITREAVAKWNGARPMVEGSGSGLLLQIPVAAK